MTMPDTHWCPTDDGARWIFPTCPSDTINQYVDFLHRFTCNDPAEDATLLISADTDFVVWLNGALIGHGQYSDYPDQKTYERFTIADNLRPGHNVLAVTVFYNGRNSSMYRRGDPGLAFAVIDDETIAASGTDTLSRTNPCYHSGPIATVSGQLFYTFGYDARGDDEFHTPNYVAEHGWALIGEDEATSPADRANLAPRPISRLVRNGVTEARIQATGTFRRDLTIAEKQFEATAGEQTLAGLIMSDGRVASSAWLMQHDYLSARTSFDVFDCPFGTELTTRESGLTADPGYFADDGVYLVVDMGRQEVGHVTLDIDVAEGTTIDMGYGEHLDDLRVRTLIGGRNFAARYVAKGGRQRFVHHFQRWAGRYLAIHVQSSTFIIHRLGLERRDYPVVSKASLNTGDAFHQRVLKVAKRTLACCMHEHYEDTPWREQSLYANDSRTQALCGYYAFGETAFPKSSFSLLGRGERGDGFLYLTAPAKQSLTIPSFTFCWMLAVRDHFLYSGDDTLAREFLPQITRMLEAFLAERKDGLLPLRPTDGIWHFYDWSGMSGYSKDVLESGLDADAPLNCFFILALEAAGDILRWLGEPEHKDFSTAVTDLRRNVGKRFWDTDAGRFRTHDMATTSTQLTQALAVLAEAGTDEHRNSALAAMADPESGLLRPGLSQTLYTFSALMTRKDLYGATVMDDIADTWGMMLKAGATTFWETIKGAGDFHNAGSLCHAWSAVPLYVYYHDLLGVKPVEPGFKQFVIDPVKTVLDTCEGTVPTPHGELTVRWYESEGVRHYQVSAPTGTTYDLQDSDGILDE